MRIVLAVTIISFLVILCFIYLYQPSFAIRINGMNRKEIVWNTAITTSLCISAAIGVGTLIYLTSNRDIKGTLFATNSGTKFIPDE